MPLWGFKLKALLDLVIEIYYWFLIARIIFPLLRLGQHTHPFIWQIRHVVYMLTEPLLAPIRKLLMPIQLGSGLYLDLSPLIAMLLLRFVRSLLWRLLF